HMLHIMTYLYLLLTSLHPPSHTPFPYTPPFRSPDAPRNPSASRPFTSSPTPISSTNRPAAPPSTSRSSKPLPPPSRPSSRKSVRSEEHTSELQSLTNLLCRLLLQNKNIHYS